MSKLIVEMEMPTGCSWVEKGIEKRCPMAGIDHYLQIRCRVQSGRIVHTINKSGGVDRPSWCPIKGEISEIELMHLEEERAFAARNIAAERKDDADN